MVVWSCGLKETALDMAGRTGAGTIAREGQARFGAPPLRAGGVATRGARPAAVSTGSIPMQLTPLVTEATAVRSLSPLWPPDDSLCAERVGALGVMQGDSGEAVSGWRMTVRSDGPASTPRPESPAT